MGNENVMLLPHVRASLNEAGITFRYHTADPADFGDFASRLYQWTIKNGPLLVQSGALVVVRGINIRDALIVSSRVFHLNGAGVKIRTLDQIAKTLRYGGERREDLDDAVVLVVSPFQASRRGCPLSWAELDAVETYVRSRVEQGKVVVLHWASERPFTETDPMYQWWDDDMMAWIQTSALIVTEKSLPAMSTDNNGSAS
jgi:hypothetical protein